MAQYYFPPKRREKSFMEKMSEMRSNKQNVSRSTREFREREGLPHFSYSSKK